MRDPHQAGQRSLFEAVPGSVLGGMITSLLFWLSSFTSHPMDSGTAAGLGMGLVAIGSWLSSYALARRRAVRANGDSRRAQASIQALRALQPPPQPAAKDAEA